MTHGSFLERVLRRSIVANDNGSRDEIVYSPAPVVRSDVLKQYPEIRGILRPISEKLTTQEMRRLNAEVDIEHKKIEAVAREWLKDNGLL